MYKSLQIVIEIFDFIPQCFVMHVSVSKQSLRWRISYDNGFPRSLTHALSARHKSKGHHPDVLLVSTGYSLAGGNLAQSHWAREN